MNLSINNKTQSYSNFNVQANKQKEKAGETAQSAKESKNVGYDEGQQYTATSSQGDTLEISSAGSSAYENSEKKEENSEQTNISKIVSETVDTDDSDGTTSASEDLSSYTETELKQMYQNGEISKADYDEEIASREQ